MYNTPFPDTLSFFTLWFPQLTKKKANPLPITAQPLSQKEKSTEFHYLPHLDGFRVLALAGVLLFHFDIPHATGGFIGVDCFLVLSGFLITRNILRSLSSGTFSFRNFYIRRFWRLYPASFAVAFATVILSILVFPPDLSIAAVISALASSSLVSNIHFLRITDYFDDGGHLKPLLHTWSLSLEEQFYCFWPILLFFVTNNFQKSRTVLSIFILVVSALSVALNYVLQADYPSFVFFMLPTRVFEFGIGALCSLTETKWHSTTPSACRKVVDNVLSVVSVLVILGSYFYMPQQAQPHHVLLVLIAAAGLVITPNALLCKHILGTRLLQIFGSMTYSAYLTHWPIYVFSRYIFDALQITRPNALTLTLATFGSAFLMQVSIENPLRKKRTKYLIPFTLFLTAFFMLCIGLWVAHENGYKLNDVTPDNNDFRFELCSDYGPGGYLSASYGCATGDLSGRASNITVIGDSYAAHFIPAFDLIGKKRGYKFSFLFHHGCQLRPQNYPDQGPKKCWDFEQKRWDIIKGLLVNGTRVVPKNGTVLVSYYLGKGLDRGKRVRGNYESLTKLGLRMVLMSPLPGMDKTEKWRFPCNDLRKTAFMQLMSLTGLSRSRTNMCVDRWMEPHGNTLNMTLDMRKAIEEEDLSEMKFIDLLKDLCRVREGKLKCRTLWDFAKWKGIPEPGYRRDGHHMRMSGSRYIARVLERHWPL